MDYGGETVVEGQSKTIKTYVAGLDDRIEGGIPSGHIVLVCGMSGSMKSSLSWNILYNYAKEKKGKAIYISLEQNRESLLKHMKKLGQDISEVEDDLAIIDLGWLRKELKEVDNSGEINWFEALQFQIKKYKENVDYDLLVLDSMEAMYVVSNMANPRNELFHFFEGLRDMGLTSFLITEMSPDSKAFGTYGVEAFLSDGIIHLNMERTGRSVGRFISIVKMREVKHATDYFPLLVDTSGFKIVTR